MLSRLPRLRGADPGVSPCSGTRGQWRKHADIAPGSRWSSLSLLRSTLVGLTDLPALLVLGLRLAFARCRECIGRLM